MVVSKKYGKIVFDDGHWIIERAEPHVCIRLKNLFPKIPKGETVPFKIANNFDNCYDLLWFMDRYPMEISDMLLAGLVDGKNQHIRIINDVEAILLREYVPSECIMNEGEVAREYQIKAQQVWWRVGRLLLGDDLGLGKTLSAIIGFNAAHMLPAAVVVQAHMPTQWKREIERFTQLKVHIIKSRSPYSLPPADVYIFKYSSMQGWPDVFATNFFKSATFDECQELRARGSNKYNASKVLSKSVESVIALSATPIYNYGDEVWNVLNCIKPDCLGKNDDFLREWCVPISGGKYKVKDPQALGAYLRETFLMLRRTRAEVGRELPPINKIVHTVPYDEGEADRIEDLARKLAITVISGSFTESGEAAREFNILLRQSTGVAKAKGVAAYVKILLDSGEPVVLAGWHREVYNIWGQELAVYNPVWYTGTESPTQKDKAKQDFIDGKTNLFIISLRSGVGLDGLQKVCKYIVVGELDWSPKVHDQLIGRVDRDGQENQENQVTAIFLTCDYGSDPTIINRLGIKSSQSHGIMNPLEDMGEQFVDESRIKELARDYLNVKK